MNAKTADPVRASAQQRGSREENDCRSMIVGICGVSALASVIIYRRFFNDWYRTDSMRVSPLALVSWPFNCVRRIEIRNRVFYAGAFPRSRWPGFDCRLFLLDRMLSAVHSEIVIQQQTAMNDYHKYSCSAIASTFSHIILKMRFPLTSTIVQC